jgi:hypothetical protein
MASNGGAQSALESPKSWAVHYVLRSSEPGMSTGAALFPQPMSKPTPLGLIASR